MPSDNITQLKKRKINNRSVTAPLGVGPSQTVKLNYLRIAPRKVRSVADLIRGLSLNEAEAQLMFERRRAAKPLLKLLRSAVASAKANNRIDVEKAYIVSIQVDQGPMLKRQLPRAMGVATPIQKKMSHVTMVLGESDKALAPRFKIEVKKKVKLPEEVKKRKKGKKEKAEKKVEVVAPKKEQPGFLKRMFRRKSGM